MASWLVTVYDFYFKNKDQNMFLSVRAAQGQEGFIETCKQDKYMVQNSGNRKWSDDQQTTYMNQNQSLGMDTECGLHS